MTLNKDKTEKERVMEAGTSVAQFHSFPHNPK